MNNFTPKDLIRIQISLGRTPYGGNPINKDCINLLKEKYENNIESDIFFVKCNNCGIVLGSDQLKSSCPNCSLGVSFKKI
jgi:ribosomal protein S27E